MVDLVWFFFVCCSTNIRTIVLCLQRTSGMGFDFRLTFLWNDCCVDFWEIFGHLFYLIWIHYHQTNFIKYLDNTNSCLTTLTTPVAINCTSLAQTLFAMIISGCPAHPWDTLLFKMFSDIEGCSRIRLRTQTRIREMFILESSILGPLLFNLHIPPLGSFFKKHNISSHCYVDDILLGSLTLWSPVQY